MKKEIVNPVISFVSLVGKGANNKDFLIVKSEDGAAPNVSRVASVLKVDEDKRLVTGVVYEPDVVDTQGEFMSAETIEKTAHQFLSDYRNIDKGHTFKAENAQVVESYVAPCEMVVAKETIKKGSWVMTTHIDDDAIWEQVKKGELNAYSMGGTGQRIEHPEPGDEVEKGTEKGLFSILKDFFSGKTIDVEKADKKPPTDFAGVMATQRIRDVMNEAQWILGDIIRNIILDAEIADKPAAIGKQIDAYKTFVLAQIKGASVEKMAGLFAEPVTKAGRKIAGKRLEELKTAQAALQTIIAEVDSSEEGEEEVKKEELKGVFEEALSPLVERVEKLEKGEQPPDATPPAQGTVEKQEGKEETLTVDVIKAAVAEAIQPITGRIETLEKARGMRMSSPDGQEQHGQEQQIKKDAEPHYLAGIL